MCKFLKKTFFQKKKHTQNCYFITSSRDKNSISCEKTKIKTKNSLVIIHKKYVKFN